MARGSQQSFQKRAKERARQQRQAEKAAQREAAKQNRQEGRRTIDGEDPDLIGIRPGPQPLPEQWNYVGGGGMEPAEADEEE
jgi:hypothetical protein